MIELKIWSLLLGFVLIVLGIVLLTIYNFSDIWLLIPIMIVSLGICFVLNCLIGSKEHKVDFKLAWNSFSYRFFTLLSIAFTASLVLNVYANTFNIVSTNIQLRNEINNLTVQYQNEISSLNQTITNLQDDKTALESEIQRLQQTIESYEQQETELQRQLRLYMVRVYGSFPPTGWGAHYDPEITFSANGTDHSVRIYEGTYSIYLKNYQDYNVTYTLRTWFGLFSETKTQILSLFSEEENLEKNWS